MKKLRTIRGMIWIPAVVVILMVIIVLHEPQREGITRAMAAKSVALAVCAPDELETQRQEAGASAFPAESLDQWYVPYLDFLYDGGYLSEEETPAREKTAEDMLTYGEAERIAGQIDPALKKLIRVTKKNREKPFPEEAWWLFYESLLEKTDPGGAVKKEQAAVYGTIDTVPGTPPWAVHTSLGQLIFTGLSMDSYVDHEVTLLVRENEIIRLISDDGQEVTYRNVWVIGSGADGMEVYVGDIRREIPFRKKTKHTEELVHNLADLELKDGKITKVSVKKEKISGKLLSVQEDAVEVEGYGSVPLDQEYKVLKIYGEPERRQLSDLLIGYDNQEYVVAKGKICAVLTVREADAETIRVLLMNQGYQGLYHESLSLMCDGPMTMTAGDREQEIAAGETLDFVPGDEALRDGRLILQPADGYEIRVCSMERTQGQPCYGGRLEVLDTPEGLVLINELYLEDYLKKVIPSEMPSSYEMEALKAQAVCARTYAYKKIRSNTYSQYGAHIDDSTNFQVYNNIETDSRTGAAVDETYGNMLMYEGSPISAYYFSTSCGTTTDGSVWGMDPEDAPYLKSVALKPGRDSLNLQDNEAFSAFIKRTDVSAYDSSFSYFRWNVTTDADILTANIGGVGQVESVRITRRGAGGVALEMVVKGSEGEKTVSGQNAIRSALGDRSLKIRRQDEKVSEGWSSLPSGFLTIEPAGTNEKGTQLFRIYGGGYGHGAGMSQNGAQGMAKAGMGYEEILKFFYEGVTVASQ